MLVFIYKHRTIFSQLLKKYIASSTGVYITYYVMGLKTLLLADSDINPLNIV